MHPEQTTFVRMREDQDSCGTLVKVEVIEDAMPIHPATYVVGALALTGVLWLTDRIRRNAWH